MLDKISLTTRPDREDWNVEFILYDDVLILNRDGIEIDDFSGRPSPVDLEFDIEDAYKLRDFLNTSLPK
jgi:hypothetical protein